MKNYRNTFALSLLFVSVLIVLGIYLMNEGPIKSEIEDAGNTSIDARKMLIYKSPNCGCCTGYAEVMERQGFEVEIIATDDMDSIKEKYGISKDQQSCHTSIVANYFIEGHVPFEVVDKLLKESPDIDGIGLPRMPAGSPGMPGEKRGPFEIYQAVDGEYSNYISI